jgi:hypothetical protein
MSEKKLPNGMKLVFAPGCFDGFEGTQEELDELIKEIEQGFTDGSFFEKAQPVDLGDVEDMDDEAKEALGKLFDMMNNKGANRTLN